MIEELKENKLPIKAMVLRNIKGRYGRSSIGLLWNILSPALMTLAVWLVFTEIKTFHTGDDFWFYLATGIFAMTPLINSVRGRIFYSNGSYIKKTSVPRWAQVVADVITQFILLIISYALLIVLATLFGIKLSAEGLLFLPIAIILMFILCLGCSFLISTINVVFSDFGPILTIMSRIAIWITPVFFFLNEAGPALRTVASYNPFTYFIEMLHESIYLSQIPDPQIIAIASIFAVGFLYLGWAVFKYYEFELAERL